MGRPKGSKNKKTVKNENVVLEQSKQETVEIEENKSMKKENKKITVEEHLRFNIPTDLFVNYNGLEFTLKRYLPVFDKKVLIQLVIENVFTKKDDNNKEEYTPINKEIIFASALVKYYTDIDFSKELSILDMYDLIKGSGLLDFIISHIPYSEIQFLEKQIDIAINSKLGIFDNRKSFVEMVNEFLNRMVNIVPEGIEELKNFDPNKLGNILSIIDNFAKFTNTKKK